MIRIRYRDPNELSPGLHAAAERHGRSTTVYLLAGLSSAQRRAALRRLKISGRRGYDPKLPAAQLALALLADRIRTTAGQAGAVFRSHPAGSTVPVMVVSAGAIAFLALSAVSIQVIHKNPGTGPLSFGAGGPAASFSAGPGPGGSAGPVAAGQGDQPGPAGSVTGRPAQPGSGPNSARNDPGASSSNGASQSADPGASSGGGTTLGGTAAPTPTPGGSATSAAPPAASSSAAAPGTSTTTSKPSPTPTASKSGLCVNVGSLGLCI